MSEKIIWELPLKTVSESNRAEHWTKSSKRHKQQQFFIRELFKGRVDAIKLPATVTMIRIGPRVLDKEENLPMAFKWIKDEVGACLFPEKVVVYKKKSGKYALNKGHADSDPRITWKYGQEKGKIQGIRIEIEPMP
jgi:hypothetical protein